ncbi:MAG: heme exporter protein CcmD [Hyphomicrobium sp.]|nr:heme exporter protein CcmD [Hyphomicrobiaceae bacterium]
MELGKHAVFIWASYAAVFAVVAGMLCWLVADSRRQRKALSDLEKRGVRRRSAGRGKEDKA